MIMDVFKHKCLFGTRLQNCTIGNVFNGHVIAVWVAYNGEYFRCLISQYIVVQQFEWNKYLLTESLKNSANLDFCIYGMYLKRN